MRGGMTKGRRGMKVGREGGRKEGGRGGREGGREGRGGKGGKGGEGKGGKGGIPIRRKEYFLTSGGNCFGTNDNVFNLILVTSPEKLLINILEITQCIKKRMFDRIAFKPHLFRRCS